MYTCGKNLERNKVMINTKFKIVVNSGGEAGGTQGGGLKVLNCKYMGGH